jgi:hypothetical protein
VLPLLLVVAPLLVLVLPLLLVPPLPQTPPKHSPSEQGVPSGLGWLEQVPVVGPHTSSWHSSVAGGQTTGTKPVQTPPLHTSVIVQALPSSQVVPSVAEGYTQPCAGSQVPWSWHALVGMHGLGVPPTHEPLRHT